MLYTRKDKHTRYWCIPRKIHAFVTCLFSPYSSSTAHTKKMTQKNISPFFRRAARNVVRDETRVALGVTCIPPPVAPKQQNKSDKKNCPRNSSAIVQQQHNSTTAKYCLGVLYVVVSPLRVDYDAGCHRAMQQAATRGTACTRIQQHMEKMKHGRCNDGDANSGTNALSQALPPVYLHNLRCGSECKK